jgi:hypothetical protein
MGARRRRHRISFVGADHEGSCFCDREVPACHTRSRRQEAGSGVVPHGLRQIMRIVILGVRPDGSSEEPGYILTGLVNRRHCDVARRLTVQLLNSFTQVRFHHGDSPILQVGSHVALFLEHRFTLDQLLDTMGLKNRMYDFVMFGRISRPMNLSATLGCVPFELFQILIQVSERVFLDLGGEFTKVLPFRDGRCLMVPMLPKRPQNPIVYRLVDIVLKKE